MASRRRPQACGSFYRTGFRFERVVRTALPSPMSASVHDLTPRPLSRVSRSAAHLVEVGRPQSASITLCDERVYNPGKTPQSVLRLRLGEIQRQLERTEERIEEQ